MLKKEFEPVYSQVETAFIGVMDLVLKAADFAAQKHSGQVRKGSTKHPYINHPIGCAAILAKVGVVEPVVLAAALLHDTLEDTTTLRDDLIREFGFEVASVVNGVTDDKTLAKHLRKLAQIDHAKTMSVYAKLVKMADKLHNLRCSLIDPPPAWSVARIQGYFIWAARVIEALKCVPMCPALEAPCLRLERELDSVFGGVFMRDGVMYNAIPSDDHDELDRLFQEYIESMKTSDD